MRRIPATVALLCVLGCMTTGYLRRSPDELEEMQNSEDIVFGWLDPLRHDHKSGEAEDKDYWQSVGRGRGLVEFIYYPLFGGVPHHLLILRNEATRWQYTIQIPCWGKEPWPFELIVPPGSYSLLVEPVDREPIQSVNALSVSGGGNAIYLGDLLMVFVPSIASPKMGYIIANRENFSNRRAEFIRQHPGFKGEVVLGDDIGCPFERLPTELFGTGTW